MDSKVRGAKAVLQGVSKLFIPPKPFVDKGKESQFLRDHSEKNLLQRQLFLIMGIVLWIAFAYWDYHHKVYHSDSFSNSVLARVLAFRIVGAVIIARTIQESFKKRFNDENHASKVLSISLSGLIICLIGMISSMPSPLNYQYYFVGIVLVLFFQYGTLALLSKYAIATTTLSILILSVQHAIHAPLGFYFFPAIFYLVAFSTIGWAVSINMEIAARDRFNQMLSIEEQNKNLEAANASMHREKRKADAALQELFEKEFQKSRELGDKTEATSRFVRAAYHDTMQPLASIATLALAGSNAVAAGETAKLQEIFSEISTSGREINLLFKGLRDVFMIGETSPDIQMVSLNSIFDEIERLHRGRADEKNLKFRVVRRKQDIYIRTDKSLIKRVIGNLVSNAIKYTDTGGLLVGSVSGKATLRIDIVDTGIGIPSELTQKVFEEFYQINNPNRDSRMGLGLGLSIVRNFIEKLPGHRVSFSSKEGKGTRFSVDCPLSTEPNRKETESLLNANQAGEINLEGFYIIIVDDDVRILNSLAKTFELLKAIVVTAADQNSLHELLEMAPDRHPDILISDYRLTGEVTGIDIIKQVRKHYDWAKVPAIIFSAELAQNLLESDGLTKFVGKGDDPLILMREVHELISAGRSANEFVFEDDNTPKT